MTKKPSKKTTPETVEVKSRAYGYHTRAARGSIKPVTLNDVLLKNSKRVAIINPLAREVHSMLKVSAGFFKESMFWQKMLSCMYAVNTITPIALLSSLIGTELNSRYPLIRFGNMHSIETILKGKYMTVYLSNNTGLYFQKAYDAYRYDMILMFFTNKGVGVAQDMKTSEWFKMNEATGKIEFEFNIPKASAYYLVCLRLHMGKNEKVIDNLASQGMCIMKTGILLATI